MIGGEFDIDVHKVKCQHPLNLLPEDITTFSTGRSALYYILKTEMQRGNITQVLVPDYLCSSILIPIQKLGLTPVFYPLTNTLEIDKKVFETIYKKDSLVLIINYYGLMDLSYQAQYIKSIDPKAVIIEDDVQAYYEFGKPLIDIDYRFTSLRKWFALPDGGLVREKTPKLRSADTVNSFHQYKVAGSILKSLRHLNYYDDGIYLELFEKGENIIDTDIEKGMSSITREHLQYLDVEQFSSIRKLNASYIVEGLKHLNIKPILPVTDDRIPLFIPIWLDDRDKVRKALFRNHVFCPIHWPLEGMQVKKGAEMAEHELSIIIDQRYTLNDMNFMLNIIGETIQ